MTTQNRLNFLYAKYYKAFFFVKFTHTLYIIFSIILTDILSGVLVMKSLMQLSCSWKKEGSEYRVSYSSQPLEMRSRSINCTMSAGFKRD